MARLGIAALLLLGVAGCSSVSSSPDKPAYKPDPIAEKALIKAHNYPGLIEYYTRRLRAGEDPQTRIKMATTYMDIGSYDSALYYLKPLEQQYTAIYYPEVMLRQGEALMLMGEYDRAFKLLIRAAIYPKQAPEAYNLLGLTQANLKNYQQARLMFEKARELHFDEFKVINNLAFLDILEGRSHDAVSRLYPLYRHDLANQNTLSNLVMALILDHRSQEAKLLLGRSYSRLHFLAMEQALLHSRVACCGPEDKVRPTQEPGKTLERGWIIQLGIFRSAGHIKHLVERLKQQGYEAHIVSYKSSKSLKLVYVGPVSGKNEARQLQARLEKLTGLRAQLVFLRGGS